MGQARKIWTRRYLLTRLRQANDILCEVERFASKGGEMPARLRQRLSRATRKLRETIMALEQWAITEEEKLEKGVRSKRRRQVNQARKKNDIGKG